MAENDQNGKLYAIIEETLRMLIESTVKWSETGLSRKEYKGNEKFYRYYHCSRVSRALPNGEYCILPNFNADKVEQKTWAWVKELMSDDQELVSGFENYRTQQHNGQQVELDVLTQVNTEIVEQQQELNKQIVALTNLQDVNAERARAMINADIERIEKSLDRLEARRDTLRQKVQKTADFNKKIETVKEFAAKIRKGLLKADDNPELQKRFIEILNLTITMTLENGKRVIYPRCEFKEAKEGIWLDNLLQSTNVTHNYNKCCRPYTIDVEKDHPEDGPFYVQQTRSQVDDREAFYCHTIANTKDSGFTPEIISRPLGGCGDVFTRSTLSDSPRNA